MAFSPDGRLLATGGLDTLVMVWDVTGRMHEGALRTAPADDKSLESAWARLGDGDAAVAHEAAWSLVSSPKQAIQFLRGRLPFMPNLDQKRIRQLIADLDSREFAVRQIATAKLENLGPAAEDALRRCLDGGLSLEMRRRVERLLAMIDGPIENPALRRALRLVEVLEQMGTTEAKEVVEELAERALVAQLREEAKTTLLRLGKPSGASQAVGGTGDSADPREAEHLEDDTKAVVSQGALPGGMLRWAVVGAVVLMVIGVLMSRRREPLGRAK